MPERRAGAGGLAEPLDRNEGQVLAAVVSRRERQRGGAGVDVGGGGVDEAEAGQGAEPADRGGECSSLGRAERAVLAAYVEHLRLPAGGEGWLAGAGPRLAIAAWLTAITSVLALALAALGLLARTAIDGWPAFARTVCESVTTGACPPAVYRSAAYELGLAITAFLGGITMVVLGWRYGRSLRRASVRTRAHAEAARITGRRIGAGNPAFVLDATQPAVYCVPGRSATIVLTTGALAVLGPDQLTAVLAHERAHLAGRHHLLLAVTRSLATVALLAMGAGKAAMPTSAAWLPAAGGAVAARVRRLADPPPPARWLCHGLALTALTLAIAAVSALVPVFALTGI